jgi:DNA-binding response OmpR family regulator
LKPVEPAIATPEIFKNLMSFIKLYSIRVNGGARIAPNLQFDDDFQPDSCHNILKDITKQRKFHRRSTLKPVEPAIAIFEIIKNLMSFSIKQNAWEVPQVASILIVEDEIAIAELIELQVKLAGHSAKALLRGDAVLDSVRSERPDLVILDVMLPGRDGFSIMRDLRPLGVPVIFLTAKERVEDRVAGLALGADDYVLKPFAAIELIARIEAVLRRCAKGAAVFCLDDVEVRLDERAVFRGGQRVELTAREFELLRTLVENKNLALSRDKLLELAWGFDFMGETRTVDVHVQRLRKKLGLEDRIKTVFKHGYRLEAPR